MGYDLEKYREKRERVLGVRKRGMGFGAVAAMVALTILVGLSVVVIPKSIAFFTSRHLEDAIFKLEGEGGWQDSLLAELKTQEGIRGVEKDARGTRLVITYDHAATGAAKFSAFFARKGIAAVLLNQVSHSQRLHTMEKEAEGGMGQ
ncbi:hypothetical protein ACUUL3_10550 [Thiovibrio sp. JS02]